MILRTFDFFQSAAWRLREGLGGSHIIAPLGPATNGFRAMGLQTSEGDAPTLPPARRHALTDIANSGVLSAWISVAHARSRLRIYIKNYAISRC